MSVLPADCPGVFFRQCTEQRAAVMRGFMNPAVSLTHGGVSACGAPDRFERVGPWPTGKGGRTFLAGPQLDSRHAGALKIAVHTEAPATVARRTPFQPRMPPD